MPPKQHVRRRVGFAVDDGDVVAAATGQPGRILHVSSSADGGVSGVAFSPDGQLLASADIDGTVRLWNPATGQPGRVLHAASSGQGGVLEVAFSPDGQLLASANDGHTVELWNVSAIINPYGTLCADVGAPTWQEWKQYAPGEPQPRVC